MKIKRDHFALAVLVIAFAIAVALIFAPPKANACENTACGAIPAPPSVNYNGGENIPLTLKVQICLRNDLWEALAKPRWWREALGNGKGEWLKLNPVQQQCRTRYVFKGASVGTFLDCVIYRGWVQTQRMYKPRVYVMVPAPMPAKEPGT